MLFNGGAGSWEDAGVSEPTVIKDGSTYHLWYTGDEGRTQRIGHATSSDGITWDEDLAIPVLDLGVPGAWVLAARLWPECGQGGPGIQALVFRRDTARRLQTGYALSPNGSAWTRWRDAHPGRLIGRL